nr:lectin-like protein [uncultured Mediterranean phage uvMED]
MFTFPVSHFASAEDAHEISQSIRFNDGDTPSLSRTIGTPTSTQKFTFSTWIKPSTFFNDTASRAIFSAATPGNSSSDRDIIGWENDALYVAFNTGSWNELKTSQVFRDPAAWNHIVVAMDTTQATASNRTKIYVNGSQVTNFSTEAYVSQNDSIAICTSGKLQAIGAFAFDITSANDRIDGYLAEITFIDGQALGPSSFGRTDPDSSSWVPRDVSSLTFSGNSFHIDGRDASDLGDDESGLGNDFTSSGLSTNDKVLDTPTDNFATWDSSSSLSSVTFANGNLEMTETSGSTSQHSRSTQSFTSGAKHVCEMEILSGSFTTFGICNDSFVLDANGFSGDSRGYFSNGNKVDSAGNGSSYAASYSTGDIIRIEVDLTSNPGSIVFFKNNSSQGTAFSDITSTSTWHFWCRAKADSVAVNFGQLGGFTHTPTSGFIALSDKTYD